MPYYIDSNRVKLEGLMSRITGSDLAPGRRNLPEDIFDLVDSKKGEVTRSILMKLEGATAYIRMTNRGRYT